MSPIGTAELFAKSLEEELSRKRGRNQDYFPRWRAILAHLYTKAKRATDGRLCVDRIALTPYKVRQRNYRPIVAFAEMFPDLVCVEGTHNSRRALLFPPTFEHALKILENKAQQANEGDATEDNGGPSAGGSSSEVLGGNSGNGGLTFRSPVFAYGQDAQNEALLLEELRRITDAKRLIYGKQLVPPISTHFIKVFENLEENGRIRVFPDSWNTGKVPFGNIKIIALAAEDGSFDDGEDVGNGVMLNENGSVEVHDVSDSRMDRDADERERRGLSGGEANGAGMSRSPRTVEEMAAVASVRSSSDVSFACDVGSVVKIKFKEPHGDLFWFTAEVVSVMRRRITHLDSKSRIEFGDFLVYRFDPRALPSGYGFIPAVYYHMDDEQFFLLHGETPFERVGEVTIEMVRRS